MSKSKYAIHESAVEIFLAKLTELSPRKNICKPPLFCLEIRHYQIITKLCSLLVVQEEIQWSFSQTDLYFYLHVQEQIVNITLVVILPCVFHLGLDSAN